MNMNNSTIHQPLSFQPRPSFPRSRRSLFTLVEILVAIGIFVMAMAPLMGVMSASTMVFNDNILKVRSNMFASEMLAELKNRVVLTDQVWDTATPPPNSGITAASPGKPLPCPEYNGLYYVFVSKKETENLGINKIGVSFRPPEASEMDRSHFIAGTGGTIDMLKRKLCQNSRYAYFSNGVTSAILSYRYDFTNKKPVLIGNPPADGKVYILDEVYTLWMTDL